LVILPHAAKPAGREALFSFNRLVSDTGESPLLPVSQKKLNSISEILKEYILLSN